MMRTNRVLRSMPTVLVVLAVIGCQSGQTTGADTGSASAAARQSSPYDRPGFITEVEDGRLWVMRPGDERSDKHITWIGAGPEGMTIKALSADTALAYLASKPGYEITVEDGRVWVLLPGEEKSDKHVTLIGAGPRGSTIKALSRETAQEYLAARPGFEVHIEDGRLHVMRPGQQWSDKHITLIGAGPAGMTLKALDQATALEYLGTRSGFHVQEEDGRLWVMRPGQEMSEKHITMIGVGPRGATLKGLDRETLDAYLRSPLP